MLVDLEDTHTIVGVGGAGMGRGEGDKEGDAGGGYSCYSIIPVCEHLMLLNTKMCMLTPATLLSVFFQKIFCAKTLEKHKTARLYTCL